MRQKGKLQVNNFSGGLTTDFHELNTPPNVTVDEDNVDLDRKGSRRRRKGLTYETDYEFSDESFTSANFSTYYIKTYHWDSVNNDGNLDFLVVQVGNTLLFYDRASDPLSSGQLPFTVDLDDHKATGVTSTATKGIQVASGKGLLFVVGELIDPFYITYSTDQTITETAIAIRIRDLKEQDTTGEIEDQPTTLTNARKYDLFNQGWYATIVGSDSQNISLQVGVVALDYYFSRESRYPPKSKPWWVGKRSPVDPGEVGYQVFDPHGIYDNVHAGNTLAPLGHYIVNPFAIDRSSVSGIAGFDVETETDRPTAVAFMAGRVFYAVHNTIYFSQVITNDLGVIGQCYQEADPTAEDISDLIDTDGGVILIPDAGDAIKLEAVENSLIFFTSAGIWSIGGATPGDGFTATGFSSQKVSGVSPLSARTIFNADGNPTFWAKNGIYVMQSDEAKIGFKVLSITDKKIQDFYDDISPLAKEFATGAYDKIKKRIVWLFSSSIDLDDITDRFEYDRVLNYDVTNGAFFPFTISDLPVRQPSKICDVFNKSLLILTASTNQVIDAALNNVVSVAGNNVVVTNRSYEAQEGVSTNVKYLVQGPVTPQAVYSAGLCGSTTENNVPTDGTITNTVGWEPYGSGALGPCGKAQIASGAGQGSGTGYNLPYLRVSALGLAIPTAATIRGVKVTLDWDAGTADYTDYKVHLAWGASASTLSTTNKGTSGTVYPNTTVIYGGQNDLWGSALTPAIVNTSNFGAAIKLQRPLGSSDDTIAAGFSRSISINDIHVTVYYTL